MIPPPKSTSGLNEGQRAALDLSRDLLVDAGAGAGKTQVLALRVLALLELELAGISEIVAFTFTDKAAAEMRDRVQRLLLERIAELESLQRQSREQLPQLKALTRAQAEFNLNRITTVHGFCHRLLSDHAWEAGLEPGAPLLEERAQRLARRTAVQRVLTRTRAEDDAPGAAALQRLGTVTRLYTLSRTLETLLERRHEVAPALERAQAAWQEPQSELARRCGELDRLLAAAFQPALDLLARLPLAELRVVSTDDKLRQKVSEVARALALGTSPQALEVLRHELLRSDLEPRSFKTIGAAKKWSNAPGALEACRDLLAQAAQALSDAAAGWLALNLDPAHELRTAAALSDLKAVFERVCAAYAEECGGNLDFLDLELRALHLLQSQEELAQRLCRRALYLLIDEYQDTNPTQNLLFEQLLARAHHPGRFFAVGDAKQSIYGFRGADVGVFNEARPAVEQRNSAMGVLQRPTLLPWGLEAPATQERRRGLVVMNTNYRSVKRLLEAGNELLGSVLWRGAYRRFDARPGPMTPGRPEEGDEHPVELHFMSDNARRTPEGAPDENELVASLVKRACAQGAKLSDIALLVRTRSNNGAMLQAFARHGIPLVAMGEGGLLATQEAMDCVNLLRVLANESDDIALIGLLRSPLGGISDVCLMQLAPRPGEAGQPLIRRLERLNAGNRQDAEALRRLRDVLASLRREAGRQSAARLLARGLASLGAGLAFSHGSGAEQRLANLERLLEVVRETQGQFSSLAALARELARRIEEGEDETQGQPQTQGEYVRLMTIHGSKGLEFPIVILPDIGNQLSASNTLLVRDLPPAEEVGRPMGLYLPWLGDDEARGKPRPDFEAWRATLDAEERQRAEYLRLFYVAFTRARDKLILTGYVPDKIRTGSHAAWADLLLARLGSGGYGDSGRALPGVSLTWHRNLAAAEPMNHSPMLARLKQACESGMLPMAREVDRSLAWPLAPRVAPPRPAEPESVELGTLVHAELERRILARARGLHLELGQLRPEISGHVKRAEEALATLPRAREFPEWRAFDSESERRLDLLRVRDGDEYDIVDFKTDRVSAETMAEHAKTEHADQLRSYAALLRRFLATRGREAAKLRLLVCFTSPDVPADRRLVEIEERP